MSETTALIMDEGLSSIPPEQGKEDKAGITSPLSSKLEVKFLQNHPSQGIFYPSQASKTAAEPASIFQQGKEKASIFCSLPPAWTTSDVEASFTHIQPDLQKYQNQGFLYPSQAAKSAAEPFSIFEQGKEKASIFCSLPPAWTASDVEASFTHIQPDLQKYQNQGFLYPSQAAKSAAEPSGIFQQGKEKASIFCSLPPAGTTSDVDDAVKGFFYPSKASKSAAEPSSIFDQGKEKAGTTSDAEDLFAHLLPVNILENISTEASRMAAELSSILQRREGMSEEEHLEELFKFASRPLPNPKCYGIALDTDMKKMKRGRCKYDFFKEEAISFLEGIGGSLWAEKYGGQYEVAVGNVFLCWLLEDELIIIKGKSEVLGVRAVCEDNCFDRPFFEPDPSPTPQQFGFSWRPDPFESFQAC